ncbi:MAG: recombination regulator RecX [Propionibacteriaceae bacterium]|nr:recombination regulator RecX [Propionibacteriaceae bacterium]
MSFAREIALRLLTARARSRDELRSALAKRQVPQSVIDQMLERFGEVGLVDDAAFAQAWVESGVRRGRSRRAIAQELRRKGIDDGEARQALDALPADSDYDAALELARRRARTMGGLDRQVAYRRLAAALARRGFSSDVCLGVVRQVLGESGDDG